jgi:VIT1/CCC1 family predicted Fe2+/Mn2+ transporter
MELSILIAKITSVIYLSAALGAVFSKDHYRRVLDDLFENAALTYLTGFAAVILGFVVGSFHNTWGRD